MRDINFRAYLDSFILNVPEKNNGGEYRLCSAFRHYSFFKAIWSKKI